MYKKLVLIMFAVLALGLIQIHNVSAEEALIWTGDIQSDGSPVTTSVVLKAGRKYRIVAKEIFWYNYPENLEADAQYYSTIQGDWNWANHFPAPDGHSFLQINNMDVDWGPFSNGDTGHTYSIYFTGTGAPITFKIVDWIDLDYSNNACHLPVEIYELPPKYQGLTPGFWKNHLGAWVGYSPNALLSSVFTNDGVGIDLTKYTLLDALKFGGGKGTAGAERILLRAAVAALLNAASPAVNYPLTKAQIIDEVNKKLLSNDRGEILELASLLDGYNNLGL